VLVYKKGRKLIADCGVYRFLIAGFLDFEISLNPGIPKSQNPEIRNFGVISCPFAACRIF